jgi:hypothetical protein
LVGLFHGFKHLIVSISRILKCKIFMVYPNLWLLQLSMGQNAQGMEVCDPNTGVVTVAVGKLPQEPTGAQGLGFFQRI